MSTPTGSSREELLDHCLKLEMEVERLRKRNRRLDPLYERIDELVAETERLKSENTDLMAAADPLAAHDRMSLRAYRDTVLSIVNQPLMDRALVQGKLLVLHQRHGDG